MSIKESTVFLIVDDVDYMRKAIVSQLYAMGLRNFIEARNGSEALSILKNKTVNIVLSDQDMPVMSGLNFLKAVRAIEKTATLPFILITPVVSKDFVLDAVNSGVSSILVKPYNFKSLSAHIEKAIDTPIKVRTPQQAEKENASAKVVRDENSPDAERLTILLVDDTPNNLHLLTQLFKDDYRVQVAPTGEKAIKICSSDTPPDLVLLDVMMPGMNGFEVAAKMREYPSSEHIPIIFVTAMHDTDVRLRALELGAMDFVTKPIDSDVLKLRVDNFMKYALLHKQLQSQYDIIVENAQLKDEITNITQHDAKTPLTNLISVLDLMMNDPHTGSKQREQLQIIEEMALQSINTVNLSSELYKIENHEFDFQPQIVDIERIIRRLIDIARQTFHKKRLTITLEFEAKTLIDEIPRVYGDQTLCYSLFHNLINLSSDLSREKSAVTVSILEDDGDKARFVISSKSKIPISGSYRFFEKYTANNELNVAYSAKLLTEAQNGTIVFEVDKDTNTSTVEIALPRVARTNE